MAKALLTPPSLPEEIQCRTLKIPRDKYWLGIFNSALLEMTNFYNWEQVNATDLTIEETIALIEPILQEFWDTEGCSIGESCLQPDGLRVMRLNQFGHFEELADGVWQEPTGDYTIPPTPPRDEPTSYDRRCAAAANAANVLKELYETVSDAVQDDLSQAEILDALLVAMIALIGTGVGAGAAALIGILAFAFRLFIEIAQFITMDVWDEQFDDLLKCALLACASDDWDVVTFDFDCVNNELANAVDLSGESALDQLKLFGQIEFILSVIGVDGLNLAGATTAIDDANCDDCGGWCYEFDFAEGMLSWTPREDDSAYAAYSSPYWIGVAGGTGYYFYIQRLFATSALTRIEWDYEFLVDAIGTWGIQTYLDDVAIGYLPGAPVTAGTHTFAYDFTATPQIVNEIWLTGSSGGGQAGTNHRTLKVRVYGNGDNPFGEDNCEE